MEGHIVDNWDKWMNLIIAQKLYGCYLDANKEEI
jgi:hypothetical protein